MNQYSIVDVVSPFTPLIPMNIDVDVSDICDCHGMASCKLPFPYPAFKAPEFDAGLVTTCGQNDFFAIQQRHVSMDNWTD